VVAGQDECLSRSVQSIRMCAPPSLPRAALAFGFAALSSGMIGVFDNSKLVIAICYSSAELSPLTKMSLLNRGEWVVVWRMSLKLCPPAMPYAPVC